MSDRLVPGWLVALLVALVVAGVVVIIGTPRVGSLFGDLETATPAPSPTTVIPVSQPPRTLPTASSSASSTAALPPPASIDPKRMGTISFGRAPGPDRCSVTDEAGIAPFSVIGSTEPIFIAAVLEHPVATSPAIRVLILGGQQAFDAIEETQDPASPECWANRRPIGPLAAGTYIFVVMNGAAQEASAILKVK